METNPVTIVLSATTPTKNTLGVKTDSVKGVITSNTETFDLHLMLCL
jgi:hypothetical protein